MEVKKNPQFEYTEGQAIKLGFPVWKFRQLVESGKIRSLVTKTVSGKSDEVIYDGEDVEREYEIFAEEMKSKRQ